MSPFRVLVTDHVFPSLDIEREVLRGVGAEVVAMQATTDDELLEAVRDAHGLLVCYAPITPRVIQSAKRCRIIARYGIGVDNVAVDYATMQGIVVTNVPDYCMDEVSDHTLALLLACARKIGYLDRRVRQDRWDARDAAPVHRLRGAVLGLVGFGKIPRLFSRKAQACGLEVVASDPYVDAEAMRLAAVEKVELDALLERADFVSLHAPLTSETRGLIGERELRLMKPTAFLINTSRGPIVVESALLRALREGWIAGAGLDVLETEPPKSFPLSELDNVIVTPHVGFYSEESLRELQLKAAQEVASVLSGERPRYPVNAPYPG